MNVVATISICLSSTSHTLAQSVTWMLSSIRGNTLQWRHNERDGVSNHRRLDCLLNRLFKHRSKKTSKLRVTGSCEGIHRGSVDYPHKGPVTLKMFSFADVIMVKLYRSWNDNTGVDVAYTKVGHRKVPIRMGVLHPMVFGYDGLRDVAIQNIPPQLILNSNLAKSRSPISSIPVLKSFWMLYRTRQYHCRALCKVS